LSKAYPHIAEFAAVNTVCTECFSPFHCLITANETSTFVNGLFSSPCFLMSVTRPEKTAEDRFISSTGPFGGAQLHAEAEP
jgi:hypothetical protein